MSAFRPILKCKLAANPALVGEKQRGRMNQAAPAEMRGNSQSAIQCKRDFFARK